MSKPEKVDHAVENAQINPQITDVTIGIRNLRSLTIYPLSMSDQLKTTDLITQAVAGFFNREGQSDMEFVGFLVGIIKENLAKILTIATDEVGEKIMKELTNLQASEIAKILYDVNYGSAIKNVQSLIKEVKAMFPSVRPSLMSLSDMGATTSHISQDLVLEKEESHTDNSSNSSNTPKSDSIKS